VTRSKEARRKERQRAKAEGQTGGRREMGFTSRGVLVRWHCAGKCGAKQWTPEMDVPERCSLCSGDVNVE